MINGLNNGRFSQLEQNEPSIQYFLPYEIQNKTISHNQMGSINNSNANNGLQRTSRVYTKKLSHKKLNQGLFSIKRSQVLILFDNYQLVPTKQKLKMFPLQIKNYTKNKEIFGNKKIKYKKLNNKDKKLLKTCQSQKKSLKLHKNIQYNQQQKQRRQQYNNCVNLNQRRVIQIQSQAKFTNNQSSTKAGSKYQFPTQKQFLQTSLNKNNTKTQSASQLQKHLKNPQIALQKIRENAITEEFQASRVTSQSKIVKNKSSKSSKSSFSQFSKNTISGRSNIKGSIFLPIQSVKHSSQAERILKNGQDLILGGYIIIQDYMETLNRLAQYADQITEIYDNTQDWEELIFLAYKKYYLGRLKLWDALEASNIYFFQNFNFKLHDKNKECLKKFFRSQDAQMLKKQIRKQNIKISDSLRNIYNLAIEKSGNYINMQLVDNFSCEIYRLVIEEIEQLKVNYYVSPDLVKPRIKSIIKFLTSMAVLDKKQEAEDQLLKFSNSQVGVAFIDKLIEFIKFQFI